MKRIIRRCFFDFIKEENWINEMSSKGMDLIDCKGWRYTFSDEETDKYIYRIELLDKDAVNKESKDYLEFLKENNIEQITVKGRWVYLRRREKFGSFTMYTDMESKIKLYKRVHDYWMGLAAVALMLSISSLATFMDMFAEGYVFRALDAVLSGIGIVGFVGSMVLFSLSLPINKKVKQLKAESEIME